MSEDFKFPSDWIQPPDIQTVLLIANVVKQQVSAMWANDSEFSDIDQIVDKARSWVLDATTAILQIQGIRDSKQAYH